MGLPPVLEGAAHVKDTDPLFGVAVKFCGAPGVVLGVAVIVLEFALLPAAFTACTKNVYDAPLVRPVTLMEVEVLPVFVQLVPPLLEYR